tara:strand:+ start:133 stop:729 length:597 start_codon:yes stop_codon:yes gene_type:complete
MNKQGNIMELKFKLSNKLDTEYNYRDIVWNIDNQIDVEDFLEVTHYPFKKSGWIQENTDRVCGYDICVTDEFKGKDRLLYLLVINGKILKGGKSKGVLKNRSYVAGTEQSWNITGQASPTNYVYSQLFRQCLKDGIEIEFYLFECPKVETPYNTSEGDIKTVVTSPYEQMETELNGHLRKYLGKKPIGDGDLEADYKE